MKYFLVIILTFLINFPSCGMVFSSEMHTMNHDSHISTQSIDIIGDHSSNSISHIENGGYDCCPVSNGILERNIISPFSLQNVSANVCHAYIFSHTEAVVNILEYPAGIYREDSPPDPSEYISLVGNSVRNLN